VFTVSLTLYEAGVVYGCKIPKICRCCIRYRGTGGWHWQGSNKSAQ